MAEKPIPENDPIVTKSYALYYLVAMVILMASLMWALWDEAFGQRPWKAYQHEWKDRYSAFLKTARSKSAASEKDVESTPDYLALKQAYTQADQQSKTRREEIRKELKFILAERVEDVWGAALEPSAVPAAMNGHGNKESERQVVLN